MTRGDVTAMHIVGTDEWHRPAHAAERHGRNVSVSQERSLAVGNLEIGYKQRLNGALPGNTLERRLIALRRTAGEEQELEARLAFDDFLYPA